MGVSLEEFKGIVRGIPLLADETFRSGDYGLIDERGSLHYLIYPFLGSLGYNVFNPGELRLGYRVGESESDLSLFNGGELLASFSIRSLAGGRLSELSEVEIRDELDRLSGLGSVLVVLTNGLDYRIYVNVGEEFEELLSFDLFGFGDGRLVESGSGGLDEIVVEDDSLAKLVYGMLVKRDVTGRADLAKFYDGQLVRVALGREDFLESRYMIEVLRSEFGNVSTDFEDVLIARFNEVYGDDLDEVELRDRFGKLLEGRGRSITGILSGLYGGVVGFGEVTGGLVAEISEDMKREWLDERWELERASYVDRLEKDLRGILENEYELREFELTERWESELEERVVAEVTRRLAEGSESVSDTGIEPGIEPGESLEITGFEVAELTDEGTDELTDEDTIGDIGLVEGSDSAIDTDSEDGADLADLLSQFENAPDGVGSDTGAGSGGVSETGASLSFDDWTKPYDYADTKEESREEERGKGESSGGAMDLNSLLGI